jgi:predicted transcriptional regulator
VVTTDQIRYALSLLEEGMSLKEIAQIIGVTDWHIAKLFG